MSKIVDAINSGSISLFEESGFLKRGPVDSIERIQIGFARSLVEYGPDIDREAETIHLIREDVHRFCHSKVLNYLLDSPEFSALDLRTQKGAHALNSRILSEKIFEEIRRWGYKNVLASPRLATIMQDSSSFIPESGEIRYGSFAYRIGSIYGYHDIYVDPILKWDDQRMVLFPDINVVARRFECRVANYPEIMPRLCLEFEFGKSSPDRHMIFVIDDDCPDLSPAIVSHIRNIKIDGLLNEED